MVKGKVQRAATYQPGYDVVCVRAPSPAIDALRSRAKRAGISISQFVCAGLKLGPKKRSHKAKQKAAKTETTETTAQA